MYIYRMIGYFSPYTQWEPFSSAMRFRCSEDGQQYTLECDGRLSLYTPYKERAEVKYYLPLQYKGKVYKRPYYCSIEQFESGERPIYDGEGNVCDFDLIKTLMLVSLPENWTDDKYVSAFHFLDREWKTTTLVIYDHNSGACKQKDFEGMLLNYFLVKGRLICSISRGKKVRAYDMDFNEVWTVDIRAYGVSKIGTSRSLKPQPLTETQFVVNIGSFARKDINEENAYGHIEQRYVARQGIVRCFNSDDGSVHWEHEFEYGCDDLLVYQQRLFAFSYNQLFELSVKTGEIIKQVETGLDRRLWAPLTTFITELYITQGKLFVPYLDAPCVLVYDVETLELLKCIDLPDDWHSNSVGGEHQETGDIFIALTRRSENNLHENTTRNNKALLRLNPDRLEEPVEYEAMPNIHVETRPSADEEGCDEIWVDIQGPHLADALRFGELYAQDQACISGYSVGGDKPNRRFNGKVHLRYTGCEESAEKVREHFGILEESFAAWAKEENIYSGTKKRTCTLDAQYIEA